MAAAHGSAGQCLRRKVLDVYTKSMTLMREEYLATVLTIAKSVELDDLAYISEDSFRYVDNSKVLFPVSHANTRYLKKIVTKP
jgi:hypothetical protein